MPLPGIHSGLFSGLKSGAYLLAHQPLNGKRSLSGQTTLTSAQTQPEAA